MYVIRLNLLSQEVLHDIILIIIPINIKTNTVICSLDIIFNINYHLLMLLLRLNSDGSMDNTFGTNGKVVVNNIAGGNDDDYGRSIYVDSYGKVYVTGDSYNGSNWDMYVIEIE